MFTPTLWPNIRLQETLLKPKYVKTVKLLETSVRLCCGVLQFINSDFLVVSSSLGTVKLLKIDVDISGAYRIINETIWDKIHHVSNGISPCTSFALYDNDIATVGEDGRINLLTAQKKGIVRTIGK